MQIFWLWAPLHFDDCCTHLALFERADGERWLEQALVVPVLPDTAEPEHLARSEYDDRVDAGPAGDGLGDGHAQPQGRHVAADHQFEKLYTFRMRGIGYMHPQFSHGCNHGELEVGGESVAARRLRADRSVVDPHPDAVQGADGATRRASACSSSWRSDPTSRRG